MAEIWVYDPSLPEKIERVNLRAPEEWIGKIVDHWRSTNLRTGVFYFLREPMTEQTIGLTADELVVLSKITDIHSFIKNNVMIDGESKPSHMQDVTFYIHGLQTIIMSQAAARAHPTQFRLLGE